MADIRPIKTPAEQALASAFGEVLARLPGSAEVKRLRQEAFLAFDANGLPHRRVEDWKYTDLRAVLREAKPLAPPPGAAERTAAKAMGAAFAALAPRRLVLANGAFVPELSDLAGLEPGLAIVPMAQALAEGHALVRERLGRLAPKEPNAALDLNTAFMGDGAVIHVGKAARIERPIQIVHAHAGEATATFARVLVVVEDGAALTLVKSFEGPDGVDYQTNAAIELFVGDGCDVEVVRHQAEGDAALHLTTLLARVGAKSRLTTFSLNTGAALARHQVHLTFAGDHAHGAIRGASLLRGSQHADTTLVVDHVAPHGESREQFKTVLDGEARGVFQGKIIVRAEAQKTDGKMSSNALLLSETAEMANKPELEIYADDVVCGHGATSGDLDEDLMFYLRARGIPKPEAEALLIQSFVGEAIEQVEHEAVRDALMAAAGRWLAGRRT